jgi:hypothetical protein
MTMASISQAASDEQLRARVLAAAQKEIIFNEELANTEYGKLLARGNSDVSPLIYRVAVDTEAAYEGALQAGRAAPGHDADIITDGALTSAVVAGWPMDVESAPMSAPPVINPQ